MDTKKGLNIHRWIRLGALWLLEGSVFTSFNYGFEGLLYTAGASLITFALAAIIMLKSKSIGERLVNIFLGWLPLPFASYYYWLSDFYTSDVSFIYDIVFWSGLLLVLIGGSLLVEVINKFKKGIVE